MATPFLGSIHCFAGNFAPLGYAFCNGQLQSIAQNNALFTLIGTTYGGDGQTTFALPDLQGRVPVHSGQGPGLSNVVQGEKAGTETVTLTVQQLPAHNHAVSAEIVQPGGVNERSAAPGINSFIGPSNPDALYRSAAAPAPAINALFSAQAISNAGGNQPHANRQPFLAVNYIIALQGIFPSPN